MSEQNIPQWTPDADASSCTECGAAFTVLRRRHHCRQCGRVVCDNCSSTRVVLPQQQAAGKVRVCDSCTHTHHLAGEAALASVDHFDSPAQSGMSSNGNGGASSSSGSGSHTPAPVACILPPPAIAAPAAAAVLSPQPVAAPVASSAHAVLAQPVAAPTSSRSPIPIAVAATAPRIVPPTAAAVPVAAAPRPSGGGSSGGGLFASLAGRVHSVAERHAPGLVSTIKEHVAAATAREEAERLEKQRQSERLIAAAAAGGTAPGPVAAEEQPGAAAAAAVPAVALNSASGGSASAQVAHIPGLGAVALAASPPRADESRAARDSAAWGAQKSISGAEQPGVAASDDSSSESELRRRKGLPQPGGHSRGASQSVLSVPASSSSSSSAASSSSGSLKLDLPLRLCLVILKKSSGEMKERYAHYLATKAARCEGDEPLSFAQFMFFSTIRTLPDFLFKKTELSFCMMREEGDTLVFEENFVRYAPILAPLASKLDARQLYYALQGASIAAGAALTEEQAACEEIEAAEIEAAQIAQAQAKSATRSSGAGAAAAQAALAAGADADEAAALAAAASASSSASSAPSSSLSSRRPRAKAGGIAFPQFKLYVEALKKFVKRGGEECGWPEVFATFPEVAAAGPQEQLLVVRTGVTDTTHFPPRLGRIGLTTSFLLYESSFFRSQNRAIRWSQITRIERSDEGFWRKKAHQAASVLPGKSTKENATGSRGINIYVQEEEVVAGGSISLRASAAVSASPSSSAGSGGSAGAAGGAGTPRGGSGGGNGCGGGGKREECLTWDQPGWGEAAIVERTRTFEYMRIMLALQNLVRSIPDKVVASALVQETCMSMLRMRALEAVGPGTDPLLLNPFSDDNIVATRRSIDGRLPPAAALSPTAAGGGASCTTTSDAVSSSAASKSFVSAIAASISHAEAIKKSKSSWLFAVLPGLQDRAKEKLEDDIDPEFAAHSHYKTAEELAVLARAVEQPFSLKNLAYNVKLFRHQFEPVMLFFALVRRIRDWENPLLTLVTVVMLLNMAYRDLLSYLPALLVLAQIAVLATLRYYPDALQYALGMPTTGKKDGAGVGDDASYSSSSSATIEDITDENGEFKEEAASRSSSTPSKSGGAGAATAHPVAASSPAAGSGGGGSSKSSSDDGGGLLSKLKNFRDVAVRTKEYLHSVQNQIGEYNVKMMKIEGLYKWRSPDVTQKFFLMLCGAFLVLVWIPFRFLFPVLRQCK